MTMIWPDADERRKKMVESQIAARGITDERVLDAMRRVPRELMANSKDTEAVFQDGPLPIGCGQTISQPYIVAYMTEALRLRETDRVLEIGTGSGYQTAVLAELVAEVYTIEIIEELSTRAHGILEKLGYQNIHFRSGDGHQGWSEAAPFDAIIITAAPDNVPNKIVSQLADGGRMVVPAGKHLQYLYRIVREGERSVSEKLIAVRFVPMTGMIGDGG